MKINIIELKEIIKQVIKENKFNNSLITEDFYNYLLDVIESDDDRIYKSLLENTNQTPEEYLNELILTVTDLTKTPLIKLYRVVFIKNITDINKDKLGIHWVKDPNDFHEEMIDELLKLVRKKNNKITINDLKTIEATFSGNDINLKETLINNVIHPFEEEITIKENSTPKKIKLFQ